jgi:hypothetical protein
VTTIFRSQLLAGLSAVAVALLVPCGLVEAQGPGVIFSDGFETGDISRWGQDWSFVPECDSPEAEWIWCDDFEADRLDGYFEYIDDDGDFLRLAGIGLDGSYGMRVRFQQGEVSAGALHLAFGKTPSTYIDPVDEGTAKYREIYWRMFLQHQSGWTGGGGDKLSRATVFATSNWAQAMIAHVWSGTSSPSAGSAKYHLLLDPASGTDTAGNLQTTTYNDFPNLRWLGYDVGDTPLFDADHVGEWYCVEARVKLNDAGQSNGVFELWIDGLLDAQRSDLNWLGSYDAYGINAVFFENYWNSGSPVAQERFWDNIVVSTARIGC